MEKIKVFKGDITKVEVDAIVNAANSSLLGGGGVDGAIHRAGGSAILKDCRKIRNRQGGCPTGQAVITTAGDLPARHVIHTVGPVWSENNVESKKILLKNCYKNSLIFAQSHELSSIAFPNISTGIYCFPKKLAAEIAIKTVRSFLEKNGFPHQVIFVCYDEENYQLYSQLV